MLRPLVLLLVLPGLVWPCTYCDPANQRRQTFRQEAGSAKFVVTGPLSNARLVGENGATDLTVEHVLKDNPAIGKQKVVTLPRWMPLDPKKPTRLLVFFDVYDGRVDPYRLVTLRGNGVPAYLKGSLAIDERDREAVLTYAFKHLESPDPDVAGDAFIEFAKATDKEVGAVARKLDPVVLRRLLTDPKTSPDRLGLFAFLLGACGGKADADLLNRLIDARDERSAAALSGLLGGLIELRPADGWKRANGILTDPKRPYNDKMSALGTLRFFQSTQGAEVKKQVLVGMAAVVEQGDMADMAIEDLRRWKWWDLTADILAQYGKKSHAAPLVQNSIVRYALTCPDPKAAAFVRQVRAAQPELVRDIEDAIAFEKAPSRPPEKP